MTMTRGALAAVIVCSAGLGGIVGVLAATSGQSVARVRVSSVSGALTNCGEVSRGASNFVLAAGTSCASARMVYRDASCTPNGNSCSSHGFACISDSLGNQLSELICTSRGRLVLSQTY